MKKSSIKSRTESDRHFLGQAFEVRSLTDDPKGKIVRESAVGAIIVHDGNEISRSANVLPPALKEHFQRTGKGLADADRYFYIEHAERAAIFSASQVKASMDGATIYCTRFPCSDCARAISWAGIEKLVVPRGFSGETQWLGSQRAALRILRESGIKVRYLNPEAKAPEQLE